MTRVIEPSLGEDPFTSLSPLVALLLKGGNRLVDGGFVLNPDGWRCRLAHRLDLASLRAEFELPETIKLSEEQDTVLDTLTWCSIEGPGARR